VARDPPRLEISVVEPAHVLESSDVASLSRSHLETPIVISPAVASKLVRKKSGQLVKSSLKSSKQQSRGSLSVVTRGMPSKSEPNTPTHTKAVHFDAHLEHVKLFLAEQKPLAVSRDGSPTSDTSGTDNDFPSFIYGHSGEDRTQDRLAMNVLNMPPMINMSADIALEQLKLSQDTTTILGHVRVRNIEYQKWIAVRFTFDFWQTTSEVTARYTSTLAGGAFDRFAFSIRLTDLLARIEEKTLIMALRYTVQGREIWDNNGGQNYHARFTRVKTKRARPKSDEGSSGSDIADLQIRLENVMSGKDGGPHLSHSSRRSLSAAQTEKPPPFKEVASLASRYDLTASFKIPWKPPSLPSPPHLDSRHSFPSGRNPVPWHYKEAALVPAAGRKTIGSSQLKRENAPLGSPRELDEGAFRSPAPIPLEEADHALQKSRTGGDFHRSHLDVPVYETAHLRKAPPIIPLVKSTDEPATKLISSTITPRSPSVDDSFYTGEFGAELGMGAAQLSSAQRSMRSGSGGESEGSTPSIVSPTSSSRSVSPSPTEMFMATSLVAPPRDKDFLPTGSPADYSQFLDKYVLICFSMVHEI
jgi:Carbohydrate/starch-binding module (family 21)